MVGKGSWRVWGSAVRFSGWVIGACSLSGLRVISGNAEIVFGCPFNRQTVPSHSQWKGRQCQGFGQGLSADGWLEGGTRQKCKVCWGGWGLLAAQGGVGSSSTCCVWRFSPPCIPRCIRRAPKAGCFGASHGGLVLGRPQPLHSCCPDPGLGAGITTLAAQQGEAASACVPAAGARHGLAGLSTVHWAEPPCQTKHSQRCWPAGSPHWWPRASAMSAPVLEPPALVRSPEEGQNGSQEPRHILTQLSAALENPDIKALKVKGDVALDVGVVRNMGFIPGCHEHGTCPCASLV